MNPQFNPGRLTIARQRKKLSKKELANLTGLTSKSISNYEDGDTVPTDPTLNSISRALGYSAEFFFGGDIAAPDASNASFRSFSRMTSTQRDSALAAGGFAFAFSKWMESNFNLPAVDVPDLQGVDSEAAAEMIRSDWKLGLLPIKNMVHLLESKGIRVFSLAEDTREVNAFSAWREGQTPFVFLNTMKSSESSRFDAAHELGHLVLHRHGENKGKEVESEANAFASALLMPRSELMATAGHCRTLDDVMRIKKRWNVSAMAMVFRLHKIGVLTEYTYRSMCIEMSVKGMRTKEVNSAERETSLVLKKVFESLRERGKGVRDIAADLTLPTEEMHKLIFGLTAVALGADNAKALTTPKRRGHLSVVK